MPRSYVWFLVSVMKIYIFFPKRFIVLNFKIVFDQFWVKYLMVNLKFFKVYSQVINIYVAITNENFFIASCDWLLFVWKAPFLKGMPVFTNDYFLSGIPCLKKKQKQSLMMFHWKLCFETSLLSLHIPSLRSKYLECILYKILLFHLYL